MKDIIKQVAKQNDVSSQEVEREIALAIKAAMESEEPSAKEFWEEISPDALPIEPQELIEILLKKILCNIEPPPQEITYNISLCAQESAIQ